MKQEINPSEYIEENRTKILAVIRGSDDPFARACAWALLDRHTPDNDYETLRDELELVSEQRADS
ncbi:hypothetical protein SAMN04487948_1082 [Halogranum amylolyticum]|uniref:Uncharacterized protein n=1 Tax=Halogranum amylolyticum TaxID=660520 RepID=A0A1H8TNL2_9EURY|nr:hypothetical protein [Halogranum amylolyticum]SEO92451.1 hypothetical protein SAMN04487948_1082 [Halogranum amylolyticum]